MKFFTRLLLIALVALPLVLTFADEGRSVFARAEDATDDIEEEEDEVVVEDTTSDVEAGEEEETPPEDEEQKTQGSPDVDVTLLFTKPVGNGMDLPAGKRVELLMGIVNTGDREFVLDLAEASFRYPMDFNYYIQNFTVAQYDKIVKPQQEATVHYSLLPSEVFAGRPLGLQINLAYHDADGQDFVEAVFNSTVNIVEVDEGLDGETFFLYVFLLAFSVLLLLGGHYVLSSLGVTKKASATKKQQQQQQSTQQPAIEIGTSNKNGVDMDWLPDQMKAHLKKQAAMNNSRPATNGAAPATKRGPATTNVNASATRSSPRLRKT